MKKRKESQERGNVIHFPSLEKRLLEKGEEKLQEKNYLEAVPIFEEIIKLDSENSDGYLGLVLAYYGIGQNDKALSLQREC